MEQKSKLDPNLTARNLLSIQRIDPCAVAILDKTTHAAKYNFDMVEKAWTKTHIEGALFIIQRADKPYYRYGFIFRFICFSLQLSTLKLTVCLAFTR
ncbi:Dcp1-like decapping family protein [Cooperia oncophora]